MLGSCSKYAWTTGWIQQAVIRQLSACETSRAMFYWEQWEDSFQICLERTEKRSKTPIRTLQGLRLYLKEKGAGLSGNNVVIKQDRFVWTMLSVALMSFLLLQELLSSSQSRLNFYRVWLKTQNEATAGKRAAENASCAKTSPWPHWYYCWPKFEPKNKYC